MDDQIEIIKSNKGGLKVIHRGYMYTVHKKRQCGGIRWRCAQRSLHCKGSISTGLDGAPKINMPHNHLPDLHSVAVARGRQQDEFKPAALLLDFNLMDDEDQDSINNTNENDEMKERNNEFFEYHDNEFKKEVVLFAEKNGMKEARHRYGISEALIKRWSRLRDDIFNRATYVRSKLRERKPIDYTAVKIEKNDSTRGDRREHYYLDSMPLQERLSKTEQSSGGVGEQPSTSGQQLLTQQQQALKSQPLSPTKLRVTRNQPPKAYVKTQEPPPPPPPQNEEMCLRWNSHHSNMQAAFPNILNKEQYVDCTLAAEGKTLKCHRMILSSCSPYFEEILSNISAIQHPVLFMKDIPFWILKSLCDFMYAGEVHIYQNKLQELLKVAEILKIKGLAGKSDSNNNSNNGQKQSEEEERMKRQQRQLELQQRSKQLLQQHQNRNSDDYEDLLDPLELLEPLYEEEIAEPTETKLPPATIRPKEYKFQPQPPSQQQLQQQQQQQHQLRRPLKKVKKRKLSEQRDPSPPPFTLRKGTRSRPNVKIPKYYHSDFNTTIKTRSQSQSSDTLLNVDEIKTEPIDVEDNEIEYQERFVITNNSPSNPIEVSVNENYPQSPQSPASPPPPREFKRIKLTKPIISEVHSVDDEDNTPLGGLEVIKITIEDKAPSSVAEEEEKKKSQPSAPTLIVKKIMKKKDDEEKLPVLEDSSVVVEDNERGDEPKDDHDDEEDEDEEERQPPVLQSEEPIKDTSEQQPQTQETVNGMDDEEDDDEDDDDDDDNDEDEDESGDDQSKSAEHPITADTEGSTKTVEAVTEGEGEDSQEGTDQ